MFFGYQEKWRRFRLLTTSKPTKIKRLQDTLIMLADYHAVPLDNDKFISQYRHVFALLNNLQGNNNNV